MEFVSWLILGLSISLVATLPLVSKYTDKAVSYITRSVDKKNHP